MDVSDEHESLNQEEEEDLPEEEEPSDEEMMPEEEEEEDDPMRINPEEILAAYSIKLAAVSSDLKPLSDFEYVQYALVCGDDDTTSPDQLLERMHNLQAFREEYKILDTVQDGVACLDGLSRLQPGFVLQFEKLQPEKIVCFVLHWAAFDPTKIETEDHIRLFLGGLYYSFQCRMVNFHAIRVGARIIAECGGASMQNYNETLMMKMVHELYRWYPYNQEQTFFLNPPSVANLFFGLWKRFMSRRHKSTLQLGYQIPGLEGCQIDPIYKTPTLEIARQRMVLNAERLLQERYHYQATYALPE